MTESHKTEQPAETAEPPRQTRGWWVRKAVRDGSPPVLVAALPLINGVLEFIRPTADVKLSGAQRAELNSHFELEGGPATTVRRVVVEVDHVTVWDRLVAAGPSLLLAGLLLLLAYALWRVEVNMTAGPHQRPFTQKDERYLYRTAHWLLSLWVFFAAAELFGGLALGVGGGFVGGMSAGSFVVLGLAVLVRSFARAYRKGRKAYEELERIV